MAMFENFPYTDLHNLNLDWIIKIAKDFLDQYTHIQQLISDGETSLQNLTTEGLQQLQDKADALETALNAWYTEHSEDIAEQLTNALSDLNDWYTEHQGYLNQYLIDSINAFNTAAEQKAEETIESIPADYTELTNRVDNIYAYGINSLNLFNKNDADNVDGVYLDTNTGLTMPLASYTTSSFIDIDSMDVLTLSYVHIYCFYDEHETFISGSADADYATKDYNVNIPATAKYIRVSFRTADINAVQIGNNISRDNYQPFNNKYTFFKLIIDLEQIRNIDDYIRSINIFDKNSDNNVDGVYLDTNTGLTMALASYTTSGFISIDSMDALALSYVHIYCFYDEHKIFISGGAYADFAYFDYNVNVPATAKYIRISFRTADINTVQLGIYVTRRSYHGYKEKFTFNDLLIFEKQIINDDIIVDISGNGDFTSFTNAVYSTVDSGRTIIVKPGIYNIKNEYIDLFGQQTVDDMTDATDLNDFQFGIKLMNRKVIFETGSHLLCDWRTQTVSGTRRFSVLMIVSNVEIIGMDLECYGTFYAIHDDYGPIDKYFVNKYKNCRVIGHNLYNASCIGGGCKRYSKHIIDNCYFDNNAELSPTVRYHNYALNQDAEPIMYITNSYFNAVLLLTWIGTQTTKMTVYVNNCHARSIFKTPETSSENDNINLFKWCNEETNPVT